MNTTYTPTYAFRLQAWGGWARFEHSAYMHNLILHEHIHVYVNISHIITHASLLHAWGGLARFEHSAYMHKLKLYAHIHTHMSIMFTCISSYYMHTHTHVNISHILTNASMLQAGGGSARFEQNSVKSKSNGTCTACKEHFLCPYSWMCVYQYTGHMHECVCIIHTTKTARIKTAGNDTNENGRKRHKWKRQETAQIQTAGNGIYRVQLLVYFFLKIWLESFEVHDQVSW